MDELKYLEIGFENCETMTLCANMIASFSINRITRDLYNDWYSDLIREVQKTEDLILILLPDANCYYNKDVQDTVFSRIQNSKDITDITLIKNDHDIENISVTWNRKDDESNDYQTTAILNDGSLVIVVSTKRTAKDIKKKLDAKIKMIDKENPLLKESFDEKHGRWVKVYGRMTSGGDPVYKCSNCGQDEHVYGVEHHDKHPICRNCGSENIYPWEKRRDSN